MEESGSLATLETPLSKGVCLEEVDLSTIQTHPVQVPIQQVTRDYKLLLKISLQILVGKPRSFHSTTVASIEKNLGVEGDL